MTSVLVIGYDPQGIPGIDAQALRTELDKDLARFAEQGIDAAMTTVVFGGAVESTLVTSLTERHWDVVVVGAGIRKAEQLLPLFEQIVNLIRRHAPGAAIAFNAGVGDSLEAAQRRL
ncbi:hypothetical protein AB0N09_37155 [Streptomyces erythrochromogenes]|uniref:hypothetical protein n=1 Tax=Streptomyces erythrochromogenes TaxID=285574 RepID=UPI00341FFD6B